MPRRLAATLRLPAICGLYALLALVTALSWMLGQPRAVALWSADWLRAAIKRLEA